MPGGNFVALQPSNKRLMIARCREERRPRAVERIPRGEALGYWQPPLPITIPFPFAALHSVGSAGPGESKGAGVMPNGE